MPDVAAQERLVDDGSGQKQVRRRLLLKSNVIDADVKKTAHVYECCNQDVIYTWR